SSPAADPDAYTYEHLGLDALAVLDALGVERAVLAGASMGAHTIVWLALHAPERLGAMVLITPAYDPATNADPQRLERWDALANGLRTGGIEGFLAARTPGPEAWEQSIVTVTRQRLSLHAHPLAVADALHAVPRSRPFKALEQLAGIAVAASVVASDDEPDPGHPKAIGEAYAAAIPGAQLVTDKPGHSPVAWQGNQLSKVIAGVAAQARLS
ncbi:MAG: alpha/beta hydrolase, partial [Solirubrobacteraceae bacterium]